MLLQQIKNTPDKLSCEYVYVPMDRDSVDRTKHSALILRVGAALDTGLRRKDRPNEDSVLVIDGLLPPLSSSLFPRPFALLAVADGMGGQAHGQEASSLALRSLVEYLSDNLRVAPLSPAYLLSLLDQSVQYANQAVYERNQQQRTIMGTTLTVALLLEDTAYIAHVGDSRLYLSNASSGLIQLTQDHSLVAALVEAGVIAPEDIYTHPRRNQIYRSLGSEAHVDVDTGTVQLIAGESLLLCSDGLWEMVRDQQISAILAASTQTPDETAHKLIQAALAAGGNDNVSAIVLQVSNT